MKLFGVALAVPLLFSGCIQQIAVSTVGNIVHNGFGAFMEEEDLDFAERALPANLKLLEAMLRSDPENRRILLLLSEGYSSYSLGFVEDTDVERARVFYLRGRDFGLRILRQDADIAAALDGSVDYLKQVLERADAEYLPAIFWTAFGGASYISLSLSNPDALVDLPRMEAMMAVVAARDSGFYHGGADVFLGTLYGSRPKILGGDTERAKKHFERALEINKGEFLMTHVYYARSVAVQTLNESLFDELLLTVDKTSLDVAPEFRLPNAIAKKKAQRLVARKEELF